MTDRCYVCARNPRESAKTPENSLVYRVTCPRCGTYKIAHKLISGDKDGDFLSENERLRLSHAIRKATDAHGLFGEAVLTYETVRLLAEQHPLPDPVDQADLFVENVARRSSYGELTETEATETWAARIGVNTSKQMFAMQKELTTLIVSHPLATGGVRFDLTLEGWKRARELRRVRGPGNQAFVAMWFHAEMDVAFDQGFAPALQDTGHQPYRVDRDVHNNKIDDQIVSEIRRSKLVVVDATGARPNAYFEAGFAMGLGIPVIWCCCDSSTAPGLTSGTWTDNLPFDIRQHAFTFWSDPTDLRKKLTARIRALGFDPAWNHGQVTSQ